MPDDPRKLAEEAIRLAKRCEELEGGATRCHRKGCSRPAVACVACVQDVADDAGERADAEINAETIDRLAALESRVGALVDAECDLATGAIHYGTYKDRLAALRSPVAQVERDAEMDGLRAQVAERAVVEVAVAASEYERDMDPDDRIERFGARFDVAESCRRWEALDAAVDALLTERGRK